MKKYFVSLPAVLALALIPQGVRAAASLWIYCGGNNGLAPLPGCPSGFEEHFSPALTALLITLPRYAYILGVLFIMIGGVYMVISAGDTEKVTKGKNTIIWAIIGIFVMQFAQTVIEFIIIPEVSPINFTQPDLLVQTLTLTIIEDILILMYIVLVVVAIVSGMRMVLSIGKDEEFKKGKDGLLWAAIGAIVINLAQALANAFCLVSTSPCYL